MNSPHSIEGKVPEDFTFQLSVWNYSFNEQTNHFFKYVGVGMLVLNKKWEVKFVVRSLKGDLRINNTYQITESIEEIPYAESIVYKDFPSLTPLMLSVHQER